MCFWPNLAVCAIGLGAGVSLSLFLHLEEAARSSDCSTNSPVASTAKLSDEEIETLLFVHKAVANRIQVIIQEEQRRKHKLHDEHDNGRPNSVEVASDVESIPSSSSRSSKVIEWLETGCGASEPSSETANVQPVVSELMSFSLASNTEKNTIIGLDLSEQENFEKQATHVATNPDFQSNTSSECNPHLNDALSDTIQVSSVAAQPHNHSSCSTTTATPKGDRSLSPVRGFPSTSKTPSAEEIQQSLDNKEFEFVEGSVSNLSIGTTDTESPLSDFSTIALEDGTRVGGQRYAVCVVLLNEIAFQSAFLKDRYKGPRFALHLLHKRTTEFLKIWKKDMPKSFHVVFYFDKNAPRLSNPDKTTQTWQLLNFLSALQMPANKQAKVTVISHAKYPEGIWSSYKKLFKRCLSDRNCIGFVVAGSSWTPSSRRVDVVSSGILKSHYAQRADEDDWSPMLRLAVVQNMKEDERVKWGFKSSGHKFFWNDLFADEGRKVKNKDCKPETCPRRRKGFFCYDVYCRYSHEPALISL